MSNNLSSREIFYSYAEADEALCNEMDRHLSTLRREGLITTWYKRQITAGTDQAKVLDHHLRTASVILLLISANFIASDYCYDVEMPHAMQRHKANEACVIPVLLRPADWQKAPFGTLKVLPSNGTPITEWRNRDAAFTDVVQGIRAALEGIRHLTVSSPSVLFPRIWNIPLPRNPVFTGSEEALTQLADTLKTSQHIALSQPQAVSGLGGIGKTQIAVEYAYRSAQYYQAVLWASAETSEALLSGYLALAKLLNLPEQNEQDQTIPVKAVLHWLGTHTEWLLILDNADDLAIIREFLPSVFGGHIILTTRAQAMGKLANRIEVDFMEPDIGALFLLRRTSLLAPDASLKQATPTDTVLGREISEELGGLPLALDQAGAYIEETQCSIEQYISLYRTQQAVLLQRRGGFTRDHPESVATTWSLAFEKLKQTNPAATDLLRLCAFLAPGEIPEDLLRKGASELGPVLEPVASDAFLLNQVIEELLKYSLIHRLTEGDALSVHRLVQAALKHGMSEEQQRIWAERTVRAVNLVLPDVEVNIWPLYERYLSHTQVCAVLIMRWNLSSPEAARLLDQTGYYVHQRGQYQEAEPLLRQALAIREQQLGPQHVDTTTSLNNLGSLCHTLSKYEEAERLLKKALSIRQQQLGFHHVEMVMSLNNLASLYLALGKYREAEPLLKQGLLICEQHLGLLPVDTVHCLNNLGSLYWAQGKYREAKHSYQRALAICEQILGQTHSDTIQSLNGLGGLYWREGNYYEAGQLFNQALNSCEQVLGAMHPNTAVCLETIGGLYWTQKNYEKAEQAFRRALAIHEQVLGPTHPDTAQSMVHLGVLSVSRGNYHEAEAFYQQALVICEHALGSRHLRVAECHHRLGNLSMYQGNYHGANHHYQQTLALRKPVLEPTHPDVIAAEKSYIRLLFKTSHIIAAIGLVIAFRMQRLRKRLTLEESPKEDSQGFAQK